MRTNPHTPRSATRKRPAQWRRPSSRSRAGAASPSHAVREKKYDPSQKPCHDKNDRRTRLRRKVADPANPKGSPSRGALQALRQLLIAKCLCSGPSCYRPRLTSEVGDPFRLARAGLGRGLKPGAAGRAAAGALRSGGTAPAAHEHAGRVGLDLAVRFGVERRLPAASQTRILAWPARAGEKPETDDAGRHQDEHEDVH